VRIKQDGLAKVVDRLAKVDDVAHNALRTAVYLEFLQMMRVSIGRVPVDTGRLRATAYVTLPPADGPVTIEAGYATAYAVRQHEEHATKRKYLEGPANEAARGFSARVAARVKQAIESGRFVNAPMGGMNPAPIDPGPRTKRKPSRTKAPARRRRGVSVKV
jgi:hypothetical protein